MKTNEITQNEIDLELQGYLEYIAFEKYRGTKQFKKEFKKLSNGLLEKPF
jgi:hypothetical protein